MRGLASPLIFYRETSKTVLVGSIRKLGTRVVPGLMRDFLAQETASVQFQLHSGSGFSADLLHSVDEGQLDPSFTSTPGDPARSVLARCRKHSI